MKLLEYLNELMKLNPKLLKATKDISQLELSIRNIIENCDVSQFEVFDFSFLPYTRDILNYTIFAEKEADSVAIDNNSGEIVNILYTEIGHFDAGDIDTIEHMTPVAINEIAFFKAMLIAVEMTSKENKGEISFKDVVAVEGFIERSIPIAGGEKYRLFWDWYLR